MKRMFSPAAGSNIHRGSPNAASLTTGSFFWKVEAHVYLTDQQRFGAHILLPLSLPVLAAMLASCCLFLLWQLFEVAHCGNGYVEVGEECDCGLRSVGLFFSCFVLHFCCNLICYDGSNLFFILRTATRAAARSVHLLMERTAAMGLAATSHVWYEFGYKTQNVWGSFGKTNQP